MLAIDLRALIAGGGAPEIELALQLGEYANSLTGATSYCIREFARALEVGQHSRKLVAARECVC